MFIAFYENELISILGYGEFANYTDFDELR